MSRFLPPICFLVALAMLIVCFCILAVGPPEASVDLHQARAAGDDQFTTAFEADLKYQQNSRLTTIGLLLFGSVGLTITGFRAMGRR